MALSTGWKKISPFTLIGVFVVLVLLNFETLFAIRHHLPGGIDLSISEFCYFIIYCFLASLIISIISLRILRKFSQSLARFRNFAFLCTRCFLCICLDCQFLNTPSGFPNINLQSYQHLPSEWSCISELGVLICFPVKSAPSQIGSSQIGPSQIDPNSNRPQVKSAPVKSA